MGGAWAGHGRGLGGAWAGPPRNPDATGSYGILFLIYFEHIGLNRPLRNEWSNEKLLIQVVSKLAVCLFKAMFLLNLSEEGSGFPNIFSILQSTSRNLFSPHYKKSKLQDPAPIAPADTYSRTKGFQ